MFPSIFQPKFSKSYAETHYKFKLPWSPLFQKLPEILLDAPHQCLPGKPFNLYLIIKDADYFPITIQNLSLHIKNNRESWVEDHEVNEKVDSQFKLIKIPLDSLKSNKNYEINGTINLLDQRGRNKVILNHNFRGIPHNPLQINMLEKNMPYPDNWYAGEMHCHSTYSSDPVEFGGELSMLQEAADSIGLDFVLCTDHSYDFYYEKNRYMKFYPPNKKWEAYQKEIKSLNKPNSPILIPGEEVSCGNSKGENVHLLVMGHPDFIHGLGDGGRRWFNNKPDLTVAEVLEKIDKTPSFAAHPKASIGLIERWLFRRGVWNDADLPQNSRSITGLQFWNGNRELDFSYGRAFWVKQLLMGKKVLPIGANDAHGDLNQNIGIKIPLVSLYRNRNHLFGKIRTLIKANGNKLSDLQEGIRKGQVCCTDGPFASLQFNNSQLNINLISNTDFGSLSRCYLFSGKKGDVREMVVKSWNWEEKIYEHEENIIQPSDVDYVRMECWTDKNCLAITSPIYFN